MCETCGETACAATKPEGIVNRLGRPILALPHLRHRHLFLERRHRRACIVRSREKVVFSQQKPADVLLEKRTEKSEKVRFLTARTSLGKGKI
jgi:hypothetical protein